MGLNLDPWGDGPLKECSFTGCAVFAVWGSEMTWLTSWTGTIYQGLRFFTLSEMVLKEVDFWGLISNGLERGVLLGSILNGLERTSIWYILRPSGLLPFMMDCLVPDSWSMVLKEASVFALFPWSWKKLTNGLERTQISLSAFSMEVYHLFWGDGLERNYWCCFLSFLWLKQT